MRGMTGRGLWSGTGRLADEYPFWNCGLCADPIDWYQIPNYDVSSGTKSFDFQIEFAQTVEDRLSPTGYSPVFCGHIDITLTAITDEDGISSTSSMTATAATYESNGWIAGFGEVDSYNIRFTILMGQAALLTLFLNEREVLYIG